MRGKFKMRRLKKNILKKNLNKFLDRLHNSFDSWQLFLGWEEATVWTWHVFWYLYKHLEVVLDQWETVRLLHAVMQHLFQFDLDRYIW